MSIERKANFLRTGTEPQVDFSTETPYNPRQMKPKISIDRISELAHLKLEEEEKAKLSAQLVKVVEWVSKLEELEFSDSKGEVYSPLSFCLPLREDKPQPSLPTEDVLSNSPEKAGKFIRVPKVIEDK